MSGGSYSYLCNKAEEPEELVSAAADTFEAWDTGEMMSYCMLRQMAAAIRKYAHPNAEQAAARTEEVKVLVDQAVALLTTIHAKIRETAAPLAGVWKAVEWHADMDWSEKDVLDALDDLK